jgi:hypothetical protein
VSFLFTFGRPTATIDETLCLTLMRTLPLLSLTLLCLGCKPEPKVSQYDVKAEAPAGAAAAPAAPAAPSTPTAAAPMVAPASMKAEAASFDAPKWGKLPAGWSVGPENAMRKATWIVAGPNGSKAEVAVTVFPGSVGGLTANVNRWRGQIGLPPAAAEEIAASAKPAKVGNIASQRFTLISADGKKALDAVMTAKDGATWFFKMSGEAAAVEANSGALSLFLAETQIP